MSRRHPGLQSPLPVRRYWRGEARAEGCMTYLIVEIALWLVLAAIIGGGVGWWLKTISVRREAERE